jgi:acyl-coenzyme A synthetase/AMP-(fatty) acid ligase
MLKSILINGFSQKHLSYEDLFRKVSCAKKSETVIYFDDFHQFTLQLLINISRNLDIIIADDSKTKDELICEKIDIQTIPKITDVIKNIIESKSSITIFTSGTTGQPKRVKHTVRRFIEMTRYGEQYKNDIWAFLFNPTHMAGLQVFFQALINQNTIVYLFSASRKEFIDLCNLYSITHISATPTFYRLLAPFDFNLTQVRKITLGGEKSDYKLISEIKKTFPNARIHNIYASTEAGTLFVSHGETFRINPEIGDKVKITNNEIFVHRSLLGEFQQDEWFSTGDIGEYVNEDKQEFIITSRANDIVNIGGNRINLLDVEKEILALPEIIHVRVFAKDNSILGKVVAAEIVSSNNNLNKQDIKKKLAVKLPPYMVPMSINIVEELSVTRTGKLKRK